jgi:hypothetical protein
MTGMTTTMMTMSGWSSLAALDPLLPVGALPYQVDVIGRRQDLLYYAMDMDLVVNQDDADVTLRCLHA